MSYDPGPPAPKFIVDARERAFDIDELDVVRLSDQVRSDDGRDVPAGSTGTVVGVWGEAEAFEVEFSRPFHALATVERRLVSKVGQSS